MCEYGECAREAREWFELAERPAAGGEYWRCKDGAPEWVRDMVYEAHGDMLPDDYRYGFVVAALDLLRESLVADEARDMIEADPYTGQLLQWVASNLSRTGYVDEAMDDMGVKGFVPALAVGQWLERCEVFDVVHGALLKRADAITV